jgi:hypothetical protein
MVTNEEKNAVMEAPQVARKKRNWGSFILHFLMYGGWILVIVLVVGIIIAVSVLTK